MTAIAARNNPIHITSKKVDSLPDGMQKNTPITLK